MTLAEKLTALRRERKLSQGDLAEQLNVSRQSVSKWETGQAVPELDKIIRLADLFGISVDELVRDGEIPRPEAPQPEVTERVVYVRQQLARTQVLGAVLLVLGLLGVILGVAVSSSYIMVMAGAGMVVLGLPFLLARKHPFVAAGWVVLAVSCLILNPYTSISPWGLRGGIFYLYIYFTRPELRDSIYLLAAFIGIVRGLLLLLLALYTGRLCWKRWKAKQSEVPAA